MAASLMDGVFTYSTENTHRDAVLRHHKEGLCEWTMFCERCHCSVKKPGHSSQFIHKAHTKNSCDFGRLLSAPQSRVMINVTPVRTSSEETLPPVFSFRSDCSRLIDMLPSVSGLINKHRQVVYILLFLLRFIVPDLPLT